MQRRTLAVCLGLLTLAIFVGALVFLSTVPLFTCGEKLISEATSDSANLTATAFTSDCGATTRIVTFVNLRGKGTAFDARKYPIVFGYDDVIPVSLRWVEPLKLEVKYSSTGPAPYILKSRWRKVQIVFRAE